jgi:hypothetical protein
MEAVDLWNQAVKLARPDVRAIEALADIHSSREVFEGDPSLRWLAPNVLFEIGLTSRYTPDAEVVNVLLVFSERFFQEPPVAGVLMEDIRGVRWGELKLPCDAETFVSYVSAIGSSPIHMITETDATGCVLDWKVRLASLTFEFVPFGEATDPKASNLLTTTFNYRLSYQFPLSPTFRRERSLTD